MSVKILTLIELESTKKRAEEYGEVCEYLIGEATQDYFCDNSDEYLPKGSECAAVMVLTHKGHPNYEHQKSMLSKLVKAK